MAQQWEEMQFYSAASQIRLIKITWENTDIYCSTVMANPKSAGGVSLSFSGLRSESLLLARWRLKENKPHNAEIFKHPNSVSCSSGCKDRHLVVI